MSEIIKEISKKEFEDMSLPQPIKLIPHESNLKDLYILYYRSQVNPRPSEKYFEISNVTDFRDVITRCKSYCTNLGFRFVKVERFLSDMVEDERKARQVG